VICCGARISSAGGTPAFQHRVEETGWIARFQNCIPAAGKVRSILRFTHELFLAVSARVLNTLQDGRGAEQRGKS
jgi:hypothetical protein